MRNEKILHVVVIALLVISLFSVVAVPGRAQGDEIRPTDETGRPRAEFLEQHQIYFDVRAQSETEYRVRLLDSEHDPVGPQRMIETDEDGNYFSSEYNVFLQHDGVGEYYLELYDTEDEEEKDTHMIIVYDDQDLTAGSTVTTTDEEGDEKSYFDERDWVYFTVKIRDQYGWPPEPLPGLVSARVERDGEVIMYINNYWDDEVEDSFRAEDLDGPGDYEIVIYGPGEEELASSTFTIVGINIEIDDEYTQGQEMEIRIESNYEERVDIRIQDSTEEPYRTLESWHNQEFEGGLWLEEYEIPEGEPDGTYHVVVYSLDDDELAERSFELRKYSLDATTDKTAYMPQDTVEVHYTVEKLLDGSQAQDIDIEYMITYRDEDFIQRTMGPEEEPYTGYFDFEIPEYVHTFFPLTLEVWANGTYEDHTSYWVGNIPIGELDANFWTDSNEYLSGQTIYVTTETTVLGSPVEDAHVTVDLKQDGESVGYGQYGSSARTDDSGRVVLPIHLSENISGGIYHVNITAERHDTTVYPAEQEVRIEEEIRWLDIHLERDKHDYHLGDEVDVSYTVTKQGEPVDANVRYEVVGGHGKVYEKGYAANGSIVFTVPESFNQDEDLYLIVYAKMDQDTTGYKEMRIPVHEIQLLLNADQIEYVGGDTINFEYEVLGTNVTRSEMYKVIDANEDIIDMGEAEDGEFSFEVPEEPSSSYEARLEVVSTGRILVQESLELREASRYQLEISIKTSSSYTTDVYEPGDEIEIRYRLRAVGNERLPEKITLNYFFQGTGHEGRVQTDSPEGTFTFEVPEVSDGTYFLHVESEGETFNTEPISVEEEPSSMSLRVFGSLSLRGLIGIVLLLIILGIGFYMLSQEGTGGFCLKEKFSKKEDSEEEEEVEEEKPIPPKISKEGVSPAEEVHGWKGPEEKGDDDQIEPGKPED